MTGHASGDAQKPQPRLVLWLRALPIRWSQSILNAEDPRRVHSREPGHPCGTQAKQPGRPARAGQTVPAPQSTAIPPLRQRNAVRRPDDARVVGKTKRKDAPHRARKTLLEGLLRKLQSQAQGRVPEPGDLLHATRSPDPVRTMVSFLQYQTAI
jgi:hypothetical protein